MGIVLVEIEYNGGVDGIDVAEAGSPATRKAT